MDDMTANNKTVLASLGGPPRFPGETRSQDEYGLRRRYSERKEGVARQRAGSIHR